MSECPDCAQRTALERIPYDTVVDRLISAERRNRLMERILRDLAELESEPNLSALCQVLQARLVGAENNIERLVKERRK